MIKCEIEISDKNKDEIGRGELILISEIGALKPKNKSDTIQVILPKSKVMEIISIAVADANCTITLEWDDVTLRIGDEL